jgi:hypothetical protein
MEESITHRSHPLHCPFCEVYNHQHTGHTDDHSARCLSWRGFLGEELFKALSKIPNLPDIIGWQPATRRTSSDLALMMEEFESSTEQKAA